MSKNFTWHKRQNSTVGYFNVELFLPTVPIPRHDGQSFMLSSAEVAGAFWHWGR